MSLFSIKYFWHVFIVSCFALHTPIIYSMHTQASLPELPKIDTNILLLGAVGITGFIAVSAIGCSAYALHKMKNMEQSPKEAMKDSTQKHVNLEQKIEDMEKAHDVKVEILHERCRKAESRTEDVVRWMKESLETIKKGAQDNDRLIIGQLNELANAIKQRMERQEFVCIGVMGSVLAETRSTVTIRANFVQQVLQMHAIAIIDHERRIGALTNVRTNRPRSEM